jgi:hypothetical protein
MSEQVEHGDGDQSLRILYQMLFFCGVSHASSMANTSNNSGKGVEEVEGFLVACAIFSCGGQQAIRSEAGLPPQK